ncbi:TolC family protein [Cochleicola gelatinilyticus]|uniref:Transporter n=1 Tax=Cochleicola gelatinilyticus TaxID=1763537 RepID=A0A167JA94_9FLAO|nr:TolC family protein [Cochleicola gelatinilyticus]OAB80479.1 transporter [Cochleicola gelatinilyticus]
MRKIGFILGFVLCTFNGFAQQNTEYAFTLEEAVTFALDSNYTALNARRDIAKALKQKWETTAAGLPQISGNIAYQNNLKQPVTFIPAEFSGGAPGTFTPVTFGTKQSLSATATLNQLIFDGSYLVGLQAAKAFLDFSENAAEKTNLEVRKGIINAYGSVLLSEELVAIFEKNKENLEDNLYETRKIFENGLTEEESVEQLEITLLDIDTQLSNAIRSQKIAREMFNVGLGIPVETPVIFKDDLDALAQQNIQLAMLESDLTIEENVDYKIAYNLTEQRSLELKLEKSKALPTLSAFVNYGTAANSDEFTFLDNDQRYFQSSILGVNMNIPIFSSGMRSARTQQARIALEQSETELEETIQNVRLELNTAKSNYQFAIETYENSKKNLALAERVENKNQIKFTEGLSTSFDLRQAQVQLYNAQQQYFESMLSLINEKANIETVLNTPEVRIDSETVKNRY